MDIAGQYKLKARRDAVWPLIFDPQSLMSLIPGCEKLEQIGEDDYRGQIRINLPGVSGTYQADVRVLERDEPQRCRFAGKVEGPTGVIDGEAAFELAETGEETLVTYEAQALITGALARLSSRLVEGVAKTLVQQGLAALDKQLRAEVGSP